MDAKDFASKISEDTTHFSVLTRDQLVSKLRTLADRIESDRRPRLVLQEAYSADEVIHDDYSFTTLVLKFAELSLKAKPGAELRGNGEQFPVEIAHN